MKYEDHRSIGSRDEDFDFFLYLSCDLDLWNI